MARDYLGRLLAVTWGELSPDFLTYHDILRGLLKLVAGELCRPERAGLLPIWFHTLRIRAATLLLTWGLS